MASYIGKVQIGSNTSLIGSTLYGVCHTAANIAVKDITANTISSSQPIEGDYVNTSYDNLIRGTTIHIKFIYGNTVASNVKLQVGTVLTQQDVIGNFICPANTIISFTLDENQNWVVNDNVDNDTTYTFAEGTTDGAFSVTQLGGNAQTISVHGLRDGAYKNIITNIANNSSSTDVPTAAAVASYVQDMTGGLSGLSGAMHFRGRVTDTNIVITDGDTQTTRPHIEGYDYENGNPKQDFTGPEPGDVILYGQQEYVWTNSAWELLGDESSYALKSITDIITEVSNFTTNRLPQLTVTPTDTSKVTVTNGSAASLTTNNVTIPNVTAAGSATTASVTAGILNITIGSAPTIAETPITVKEVGTFTANTPTAVSAQTVSVGSASEWDAGSQAVLNTNDTTVVVPNAPANP